MLERLFVYGTLAPGKPNEHILSGIQGTWQPGSVAGTLHQAGWGADMGYPGIVLTEEGSQVEGQVFSSDELHQHWAMLDEFEGDEYSRQLVTVTLDDNSKVDAYVYTIKADNR